VIRENPYFSGFYTPAAAEMPDIAGVNQCCRNDKMKNAIKSIFYTQEWEGRYLASGG